MTETTEYVLKFLMGAWAIVVGMLILYWIVLGVKKTGWCWR